MQVLTLIGRGAGARERIFPLRDQLRDAAARSARQRAGARRRRSALGHRHPRRPSGRIWGGRIASSRSPAPKGSSLPGDGPDRA